MRVRRSRANLNSKSIFSKPYFFNLKADIHSKLMFSKPYIIKADLWLTEYMVHRTLLYTMVVLE